jgi:hypothetical protein
MKPSTEAVLAENGGYVVDLTGRFLCPCCGAPQLLGSAIAYCDDCNRDTCGHWPVDEEE